MDPDFFILIIPAAVAIVYILFKIISLFIEFSQEDKFEKRYEIPTERIEKILKNNNKRSDIIQELIDKKRNIEIKEHSDDDDYMSELKGDYFY